MSSDLFTDWTTPYEGTVYGRRLDSDWPEGQLAELDTQWAATDERVERARLLFEEVSLSDFEPRGSLGRRWLHRSTGVEFVIDESQVLSEPDPRAGGVQLFAVHAGRIYFFRPRDHDPVETTVLGTQVTYQLVNGALRRLEPTGLRRRA